MEELIQHLNTSLPLQILLGVLICFLMWAVGLVKWAQPMFEGIDHKASANRIYPFIMILLCVYMVLFDKIAPESRTWVYWGNLFAASIYAGYVTIPQALTALREWRGNNNRKEEKEVKIEGTMTTKEDTV